MHILARKTSVTHARTHAHTHTRTHAHTHTYTKVSHQKYVYFELRNQMMVLQNTESELEKKQYLSQYTSQHKIHLQLISHINNKKDKNNQLNNY